MKRYRMFPCSYGIFKDSNTLEQYKFEDAKKFYEDQYAKSIIISPEEYLREHNMYYARFRESQKSNLMIELRRFLEQYKLEDADNFQR